MVDKNLLSSRSSIGNSRSSMLRLLTKTFAFLIGLNLLFAFIDPIATIGSMSLYNSIFPGRLRLPYGDDPDLSFNLTVNQLDAMFASHVVDSKADKGSEYRVFLIGDSSVWGFLLGPEETLAAQLNQLDLHSSDGRRMNFLNLGYPTLSLTKDLLLLDYAQRYEPDLILWFVTLESLPVKKQLTSPILTLNPEAANDLIDQVDLELDDLGGTLEIPSFWERTIIGRRRILADILRHQIFGVLWTATHVDHHIPATYNQRTEDLSEELTFQGMLPEQFSLSDMAFGVLQAGIDLSQAPIVVVNEPIFLSEGKNSDLRYNFYYPIWAYDQYRSSLIQEADLLGWELLDMWNLLPGDVFTDSAIHYNAEGVNLVIANLLSSQLLSIPSN